MFLHADTWVSELFDSSSSSWKSSVIDVLFLSHEAEMIKNILLTSRLLEDKLI